MCTCQVGIVWGSAVAAGQSAHIFVIDRFSGRLLNSYHSEHGWVNRIFSLLLVTLLSGRGGVLHVDFRERVNTLVATYSLASYSFGHCHL